VAAGVNITAIMNPDNGPGTEENSDYLRAMTDFKDAGGLLLGYVYSCFGGNTCVDPDQTRTVEEIVSEALLYDAWYGPIYGIFVNETSDSLDDFSFYQSLTEGLRAAKPEWIIVGNPGKPVDQQFLSIFDILVTYVGDLPSTTTVPWTQDVSPYQQAHFWYQVNLTDLPSAIALARSQNIGYIYSTDDVPPSPWDTLTSYFAELVALL